MNWLVRPFDLQRLVTILLIFLLIIFVLFPVFRILLYPRLKDYMIMLSHPGSIRAIKHSFFIVPLSTLTVLCLGYIFAYAQHYTNMPGKKIFKFLALLPILSPPFIIALSWIMLFGPHGFITNFLGIRWNIFGWRGLWMVQSIAFFPYAYLLITGVLEGIDSNLEFAAANLGAKGLRTFWSITLPLSSPGLVNAALIVAIYVFADFGNPILIAGGWSVLPTEIYRRIIGYNDLKGAAALCAVLLVPTLILFLAARKVLSSRSYVTITGSAIKTEKPLVGGITKWLLFGFCSFFSLLILLVYGTLAVGAFTETWGLNWSLTLKYWRVLRGSSGLSNSLLLALLAGLGASFFSLFASCFIYKRRFIGKQFWDFITLLPTAIPGIFLGIGFLLAFNTPPFVLTGGLVIMVLSLLVWNIPLAYQANIAILEQIGPEIEEAALNLGASPMRAFGNINVPLLRTSLLSSFTMGFLRAATNLSIVIFLISPGQTTATVQILASVRYAELGIAAVLATTLFALALLVVGIMSFLTKKSMDMFVEVR